MNWKILFIYFWVVFLVEIKFIGDYLLFKISCYNFILKINI